MLTKKQHELLLFIERHLKEDQISPSFEEMKIALNLKSKSGIHRLVSALEERGFIRRLANKARALEVLKSASKVTISKNIRSVNHKTETRNFTPNVIPGNFPKSTTRLDDLTDTYIELPL